MKNKKIFLGFGFWLMVSVAFAQTNFSYTQTCYGNQTTLVASSSLPDSSISTWKWDLDGNGSYDMSGKTVITLVTIDDTVAVKLKITPKTGLADSTTKNVVIDPIPQVNFMTNNTCESSSATFSSQSMIAPGSITQFLWDFNNDGVTDDNTNDTVSFNCGPAQTFVSKLTCVSNKGCSAFAQKTTTVYPNPIASFSFANSCLGNTTMFASTSTITNADHYNWDFGDGNGNVSTTAGTNHQFALAGNYNVQMIAVTQAGCRDTVTSGVIINPNPAASLQFTGDTVLFEGGMVTITVVGGSFNYAWSTGETTDNIVVMTGGTYSCLVTDGNACSTALSADITLSETPDTVAVSGFILTPNDDNINDVFIIENISAYTNCDLKVYNMWNDQVFSAPGYQNDWKGTNTSGEALQAGAYYYMIMCDEKPMLKGNINILR